MRRPLCVDLFCGLGGWTEGFLAEGWDVAGFDIERHVYGEERYPGMLAMQDVLTLHGSQFRDAAVIVASPPCQEYSYMAMPWARAKEIARVLRGEGDFPAGYKGSRTVAELNRLFDACFRIQREACEAAGRHIPLVVENVKGAQPWVGKAAWSYGSYYLWGDVPALMPSVVRRGEAAKNEGGSWFSIGSPGQKVVGQNPRDSGVKQRGSGPAWFDMGICKTASRSSARKAASARIAKIPFALARHIAHCYHPREPPPLSPPLRRPMKVSYR